MYKRQGFHPLSKIFAYIHDVPVTIVSNWERCSNVYGKWQFSRKAVQLTNANTASFSPCLWFVGPYLQHIFHGSLTTVSYSFCTVQVKEIIVFAFRVIGLGVSRGYHRGTHTYPALRDQVHTTRRFSCRDHDVRIPKVVHTFCVCA